MKIIPQRMLELGCSQNHIKFFVKEDFSSEQEFIDKYSEFCLSRQSTTVQESINETVLDYLIRLRDSFTYGIPGYMVDSKYKKMSNSYLKRLLDSKGVRINGQFPDSNTELDSIVFPITDWVWFPKSKNKITYV